MLNKVIIYLIFKNIITVMVFVLSENAICLSVSLEKGYPQTNKEVLKCKFIDLLHIS
jgi:hypothetical protein